MAIANNPASMENQIIAGCHVTWKRDPEFRRNHQPQMSIFIRRYGYGPFFVKEVKSGSEPRFVVISTEDGEAGINLYYLQLVRTYASAAEMPAD